jgi:hypothetical protein
MPKSRAIACEDVAGRANVEDTPELLAYYDQLEQLEAGHFGLSPTRLNLGSQNPALSRCCGAIAISAIMSYDHSTWSRPKKQGGA